MPLACKTARKVAGAQKGGQAVRWNGEGSNACDTRLIEVASKHGLCLLDGVLHHDVGLISRRRNRSEELKERKS